jgi:hypothetical protein
MKGAGISPIVSSQRGRTALVVLSAVLGIGALALLFIYLPYFNSKEEEGGSREKEARRQAFEERKENFERQAGELQQKQMQSRNERDARQRRLEQEREAQNKSNKP